MQKSCFSNIAAIMTSCTCVVWRVCLFAPFAVWGLAGCTMTMPAGEGSEALSSAIGAARDEPPPALTRGLANAKQASRAELLDGPEVRPVDPPDWAATMKPKPESAEGELAEAEETSPLAPDDHAFRNLGRIRGEDWPLVFNDGPTRVYETEKGICSYYWRAQKLASGGSYENDGMTAAHRTLPFGTIVRVKLLRTGKTVDVMINDRGPFIKGRIIDLSKAAAQKLGLVAHGIGRCEVEVLAYPLVESMGPKGNG